MIKVEVEVGGELMSSAKLMKPTKTYCLSMTHGKSSQGNQVNIRCYILCPNSQHAYKIF